jgi:hypothetical protein
MVFVCLVSRTFPLPSWHPPLDFELPQEARGRIRATNTSQQIYLRPFRAYYVRDGGTLLWISSRCKGELQNRAGQEKSLLQAGGGNSALQSKNRASAGEGSALARIGGASVRIGNTPEGIRNTPEDIRGASEGIGEVSADIRGASVRIRDESA